MKHQGGLAPDKYLAEEQYKKLRRYVREQADLARQRGSQRAVTNELIIEVLIDSGLRAMELANLSVRDLPTAHGKDCIWVRDGKGHVSRSVDIPDRLKQHLARYVRLYRQHSPPEYPLLTSQASGRLCYQTIYDRIRRIGQKAGIGHLHPHMLRHTYLTRLYNIEHDLRFVQDQAGHASPTTTAIYAKTNNDSRKRQVEALD